MFTSPNLGAEKGTKITRFLKLAIIPIVSSSILSNSPLKPFELQAASAQNSGTFKDGAYRWTRIPKLDNPVSRQRYLEHYNSRHQIPAGTTYVFENEVWAALFNKIFGNIANCKPVMASRKYTCSLTQQAIVDGVLYTISRDWPTDAKLPVIKWPFADTYRPTGNLAADDIHRMERDYLQIANTTIDANTIYKFSPSPGRGGAIWKKANYSEAEAKQIIEAAFRSVGGKWVGNYFTVPRNVKVDNLLFDFLVWHFDRVDTRQEGAR